MDVVMRGNDLRDTYCKTTWWSTECFLS